MTERPPIDPPRRKPKPEPLGKVKIMKERYPTCYWHAGCQERHSPPMVLVRQNADYDVLECAFCGKVGRYPTSSRASVILCDED